MSYDEDLLYIEDANNRKLYYRFTPAPFFSNFAPLLVVLHDEGKAEANHFEYKMWNILTPLDNFEYANNGTCWLGEEDDFFVKDLLQKLIKQFAEKLECEDHIYLYGNSMGGYGAILHGILCKANAVYAESPCIILQEKHDTISKEYDLSHFLNLIDSFPIFYLCSHDNHLEDEIVYFVETCKKFDIKVHPDFCPKSGDDENHTLKKVLDMFEHVTS
ncbi:MAG: hypothetical protein COB07_08605 [Sulfurovum sp.]|nr:MAG: hypothetical protein COB07_08605 [Sulfurovum sp.]